MIYQLIGLSLFAFGFVYQLEVAARLEQRFAGTIQQVLGRKPYLTLFEECWFFGRTPFALAALILFLGANWKLGLIAISVFAILAGIEKTVKELVGRSRPFKTWPEIDMLQPQEPNDPSFPSGDALRIWYLVLIFSIALGNNLVFGVLSILLAVLVSLGRTVFGVHYLTDVLSGAGLGFLGAGTTIWLWQLFQLL